MRLRKKKGVEELLTEFPNVITNANEYKGHWGELFLNNHPIHLEIGMGRGGFLTALSKKNPEVNYIGMERVATLVYDAVTRLGDYKPEHLKFIWNNAHNIEEIFAPSEIDRIYLNFSDPWPKQRHVKKRLTHRGFLEKYEEILKPQGEIHFKTDNEGLFLFSLEELKEKNWILKNITYDLHKDHNEDNVMTEYEKRFIAQGKKIFRLEAVSPKKQEAL
ncbi:tRNA (guanosine(46)-N7)-methyltransferase TrmB [Defluviitalea raffinosedens]|uniref:tRNA (guanine-N(7)-)-methyltransferase n=1 Tax=Defluviitalea raffinosedens TaxID=1450156 RepID=A0A7C8LJ95_9FIRM|nr:tRNA (guanosine(46)-N7)-methyltransferase TrmB [Defluviitalea raffinosedens]KAE9628749.1 tRNA (guanosine(46)-N7)-methyltransferase TrmB [Defluviitalea raffinosedens]